MPLFSRRQPKQKPAAQPAAQPQWHRSESQGSIAQQNAPTRIPFTKRFSSPKITPSPSYRHALDSIDSAAPSQKTAKKKKAVPFQRREEVVNSVDSRPIPVIPPRTNVPFQRVGRSTSIRSNQRNHRDQAPRASDVRQPSSLFKRVHAVNDAGNSSMTGHSASDGHMADPRLPMTHSYSDGLGMSFHDRVHQLSAARAQQQQQQQHVKSSSSSIASLFRRNNRASSRETASMRSGTSADRARDVDTGNSVEILGNWAQGNHKRDPRTARGQGRAGFGVYDYADNGGNIALHTDWGSWSQLPPGRSSFAFSSEPSIRQSIEESGAWSRRSSARDEDDEEDGQGYDDRAHARLDLPPNFCDQPFMGTQTFEEDRTVQETKPARRTDPFSKAKRNSATKQFAVSRQGQEDATPSANPTRRGGDYFQMHLTNATRDDGMRPLPNTPGTPRASGDGRSSGRRPRTAPEDTPSPSPSPAGRISRPSTPGIDQKLQRNVELYNRKVAEACESIHNAALESAEFYEGCNPLPSTADLPSFMKGLGLDLLGEDERKEKSLDLLRHLVHLHLFQELNDCLDASGLEKSQGAVMKKAMEKFKSTGALADVLQHRALQTSLQLSTLSQAYFMHSRSVILTSLQSSIAFFLHWAGLAERTNDAGLHGYGKLKEARDVLDSLLKLARGVKESVGGTEDAVLRRGWFEVVTRVGPKDSVSKETQAASLSSSAATQRPALDKDYSSGSSLGANSARKRSDTTDSALSHPRKSSEGAEGRLITKSLGLILLPLQSAHPEATFKQLLGFKKGHVDMVVEPQQIAIMPRGDGGRRTGEHQKHQQHQPRQEHVQHQQQGSVYDNRLRDDSLSSAPSFDHFDVEETPPPASKAPQSVPMMREMRHAR
ncbi:hypothetical protein BDZ90DRAFT_231077 [Jaminaea rosea]|uniref:Uncharacterized protein n=1 Tax=Jaminaea rosea TaxID=1569628 RepID=A0A316UUT9_9BASI|nr:hypothetical protein BDZ90DRAFT_231077 [Jaminaea rosea]PWN29076.1 hypothetical protein BDZ90DRAFT_231077 [Jaminaea rosea]